MAGAVRGGLVAVRASLTVDWYFRMSGQLERWDWGEHRAPVIHRLQSVRRPRSSARNRHIPVSAYTITNGAHVDLESGLEHDLLRRVDRDPRITWIVAQPLRLVWTGSESGSHTPDLLTCDVEDVVTVWDAKLEDEHDRHFREAVAVTRAACSAVGWRHEVFTGLGAVERLNLLWLHGFRRSPEWLPTYEERICASVENGAVPLGTLLALDDGSGEAVSAVWHLVWTGVLDMDLARPITPVSPVSLVRSSA
ncbi:TnsA-like heteromeric transposase endonuclease subunit [Mycobacteroides abscessus]|uniref:TnsA-like heteromeric transposase endonuclease subunit n=3 Tax=Mycobacteroides abscessus TaxID=36809 RepID=A0A1U5HJZ4_9MYCO|nr:TnsA-like heteromeric transposase endonuclease subunit [Mycobacteroides abscessus]EIU04152.1 hypothetical protein MA5S0422_5472 [Mycobacteroides abscessus 5S-0422]EIU06954.1 hypothetical protein MA5S0421_4531 [Mycobacteroides abscessus 5S-0421]EIU11492.1 hypothetical protein MA5S0304_4296 [Mycobacteroides abscessus 5S-0304]EIU23116.1 hypothetical protein MA5S0817_3845 [Mycobacteroides abscessus 5S-0817]EIU43922.1 hypothetical protein MA5S1215_4250 [Mycobacteroides abscessus 5S-1215]EIU8577